MSFGRQTQLDDYRLLGNSDLWVSPFCLGTMTFGTGWGWGAGIEESRRIFDLYVDRGGNFIDTNGTSETFLGEFIGTRRKELIIGTQYSVSTRRGDPNSCGNHRKNMVQFLETSLRRLRTDYIDIYWMHHWDFRTPVEDVMRALDDLVRSGKVLYVGISNTPAWKIAQGNAIAELRGWTPFIGVQVEYNLTERTAERDIIPMANDLRMGVLATSPLAGGILTGKYNLSPCQTPHPEVTTPIDGTTARDPLNLQIGRVTGRNLAMTRELMKIACQIGRSPAQVALNWLLLNSDITSTILGDRTFQQLQENLGCLEFQLGTTELADLDIINPIELGNPY